MAQRILAIILIFSTALGQNFGIALAEVTVPLYTRPLNVPARSNAEYYSASPDTGLVMPVNIWGHVREPGLHFLPLGANLHQSISAAGGPTDTADLSNVRILRGGKSTYADLLGTKMPLLVANDYIYIDHSYRADLPLIFSGLSTVISIITLYFVMKPTDK